MHTSGTVVLVRNILGQNRWVYGCRFTYEPVTVHSQMAIGTCYSTETLHMPGDC
jgi:hypothetical protein